MTNIVRRPHHLLPTPIIGWERQENDSIPTEFLTALPGSLESASMAALLTGGRPPAKISWKFGEPLFKWYDHAVGSMDHASDERVQIQCTAAAHSIRDDLGLPGL